MRMKLFFLLLIVLLASLLRLIKLSDRPPGFTWDEAALGYNAFSMLKTGQDEHGQALPIVFKSFGDYKPGSYIYLTVPSVAILGLTEYATRLPSAVMGVVLVLGIFLLTKTLTKDWGVGLLAALLMAINPWALQFSRGAWEANVNLTFTLLGALFFLRKKYGVSFLFFGLTLWTYQAAKLFTPLLLGILLFTQGKFAHVKKLILPGVVMMIFVLPILWGFSSQSGRLNVFSLFTYQRQTEDVQEILSQDNLSSPNLVWPIWHSEIYDQVRGLIERYTNHFSAKFLFFAGDWTNLRHTISYYGYLHIPELISLVAGVWWLVKNGKSETKILGWWLIFAPLPSALSRDLVSGVRALPMVVPLVIISALGFKELTKNKILAAGLSLAFLFFVQYYLNLYYRHAPFFSGKYWLTPYQEVFQVIKNEQSNYDKVIFTTKLGQPYIFTLFYLQIDPELYRSQTEVIDNSGGDVGEVLGFGKYTFKSIYFPEDRKSPKTLFVGDMFDLPTHDIDDSNISKIADITYPDGSSGLTIVATP